MSAELIDESHGFAPIPESERRIAALLISPNVVLEVIRLALLGGKPVDILRVTNLVIPDGVKIKEVQFDWQRNSFVFLLQHESFAVVSDGEVLPCLPYGEFGWHWEQVITENSLREAIKNTLADIETIKDSGCRANGLYSCSDIISLAPMVLVKLNAE